MKIIFIIIFFVFGHLVGLAQSPPSYIVGTYTFSGRIEVVAPQTARLPQELRQDLVQEFSQMSFKFYRPLGPLDLIWDMSFFKQWIGDQKVMIFSSREELYFPEVTYLWQQQQYSVIPGRDTFADQANRLTFGPALKALSLFRTRTAVVNEKTEQFSVLIWFEKSEDPDSLADLHF